MPLTLRIELHHFNHNPQAEGALMALSRNFQLQLDRLSALVGQERAHEAVAVSQAVAAQVEADHAEIQAAHDEANTAKAAAESALQEAQDEITALRAQLDNLGAPPIVVEGVSQGLLSDEPPVSEAPVVEPVVEDPPVAVDPVSDAPVPVEGDAPTA
jgi:hypothetical protein